MYITIKYFADLGYSVISINGERGTQATTRETLKEAILSWIDAGFHVTIETI